LLLKLGVAKGRYRAAWRLIEITLPETVTSGTLPLAPCDRPTPLGIRAICSFAAGSSGDILMRYYSDKLAKIEPQ